MSRSDFRRREEESSLISRTSILILSAVLLVFSFDFSHEELGFYLFTLGQFGLVAFLGLDITAQNATCPFVTDAGKLSVEARLTRHLRNASPLSQELLQEQRSLLEWLHHETKHLD